MVQSVVASEDRSGASMHVNLVDIFDVASTLFLHTLLINSGHILQIAPFKGNVLSFHAKSPNTQYGMNILKEACQF